MTADLIVENGRVRTLAPERPLAEAVAVRGGRVMAVGDRAAIGALRGPGTDVLDLEGGCLVPAFADAHCHLNAYGLSLREVDCSPERAPTIEALLARVGDAARARPGAWVQARGYDDTRLVPPRHPTRWELDAASPHGPVILRRRCGHVCVANTPALEAAGITRDSPPIPGGVIDRDERGEPTGVLRERAQQAVRDRVPQPSVDELCEAIRDAGARCVAQGYAVVHDASGARPEELAAYCRLEAVGALPLRVVLMARDPLLDLLAAAGLTTGFGSEWLRIGPYKLFADGGVGPRTAALSVPYAGEPGNRGVLWWPAEELRAQVARAAAAGFAVAVHAIGDDAIGQALDALEAAGARSLLPHRVEHCSLPAPEHVARMARLGIAAVVQPLFLWSLGDSWLANLPESLHSRILPVRELLAAGVLTAASSDAPVAPSDPLRGVAALVARRTEGGRPIAPGQAIDTETALRLYAAEPARLMGDHAARIEEGAPADFAALAVDPAGADPAGLHAGLVRATVIAGAVRRRA